MGEQIFILCQIGFYSKLLLVEQGITQGNVDSPIIFNLIIDAVLRRLYGELGEASAEGSFYSDDGLLESVDPQVLQQYLDQIVKLFVFVGLVANQGKTKFMILWGPLFPAAQPSTVYKRVQQGGGPGDG